MKDESQHAALKAAASHVVRRARAGDARLPGHGRADRRLRQQHQASGLRCGRGQRIRLSRLRACLHQAVCSARVAVPSGGWRCRATPKISTRPTPRSRNCFPTTRLTHRWLDMARERISFQGLAGAHMLAWAGRARQGRAGLQRDGSHRRTEGAHRDRPRPPGHRLGRQPESRNRKHARRNRCRVRLAAAQRLAQYGGRRHLGQPAPWRRRRHGLLATCRRGHSGRRHRRSGKAHQPACCGTTPPAASCATPTPATTLPVAASKAHGLKLPMITG